MFHLNHRGHIHTSNSELLSDLIFVLLFQLHQVLGYLRQGRAGSAEATAENRGD